MSTHWVRHDEDSQDGVLPPLTIRKTLNAPWRVVLHQKVIGYGYWEDDGSPRPRYKRRKHAMRERRKAREMKR